MSSRNGEPSGGLRVLPGGASVLGGGAGAFIRRFVMVAGVPTVAGNTRTQVNASAVTETVLENPTGPVQSLLPADAFPAAFLENGDGARFGNRVKVARIGVSPVLSAVRGEGTYAAPTPPATGVDLFLIQARPVVDTGGAGTSAVVAAIAFRSRENLGAAAHGSLIRLSAGRVGAAVTDTLVDFQSGGAGVAEQVSVPATLRLIPGGTAYVIRDSANTFDANVFTANGANVDLAQSTALSRTVNVGATTGAGVNTAVNVRGAAATIRYFAMRTGVDLRWLMGANNDAEGGANAGSSYVLTAYTDAGAAIDTPITIVRAANGAMTFGGAGNRQLIIAGNAWGANAASLRMNGLTTTVGAAAGTLTNAPNAGNPVVWVPININGTVYKFPGWNV